MWNLINKITEKKTDKTCRIEKFNIEYFDGKTISNALAKYFSTVDEKHAMIDLDKTYLLSIT